LLTELAIGINWHSKLSYHYGNLNAALLGTPAFVDFTQR